MKLLAIAISASLLVGCTVDNSNNCSSFHNYTNEQTDANGLTLKPSQDMHATFEQVSAYYGETMACMGLAPDTGPTVRYVDYTTYFNGVYGRPWAGYTSPNLVFVNTNLDGILGMERDCRTDKEALKHEFIHYILDYTTGNKSHYSPDGYNESMFQKCGLGVNTYN